MPATTAPQIYSPQPYSAAGPAGPRRPAADLITPLVPGIGLTLVVSIAALVVAAIEERMLGHPVVEGLVVAILLGMAVRTAWTPPRTLDAGISFVAKEILEVAVFLLGVSVDLPLLLRAGPALGIGIVLLVILGIALSYGLGRVLGLPHKLAVLVACGNSICGNSAIAAVAPVIEADPEHVVSSIAFTAILGVAVVLGLPLLMHPLGLSFYQYGVLAGLTVYAVPQVLAAAFAVSALSGQVGTLVKLVRVLMLGPVVLFFALRQRGTKHTTSHTTSHTADRAGQRGAPSLTQNPAVSQTKPPFRITQFVPWFILGFLALAGLRSAGLVPTVVVDPARTLSAWLTVGAMAALGLGCDLRAIMRAGTPIIITVTGSLLMLITLSIALIHMLGIR